VTFDYNSATYNHAIASLKQTPGQLMSHCHNNIYGKKITLTYLVLCAVFQAMLLMKDTRRKILMCCFGKNAE